MFICYFNINNNVLVKYCDTWGKVMTINSESADELWSPLKGMFGGCRHLRLLVWWHLILCSVLFTLHGFLAIVLEDKDNLWNACWVLLSDWGTQLVRSTDVLRDDAYVKVISSQLFSRDSSCYSITVLTPSFALDNLQSFQCPQLSICITLVL